MGDLSKNFSRSEFACPCDCGTSTVDVQLLYILQAVRDHFNAPVSISSGHRCEERNKKVGGAENSYHLVGKAADIVVIGVSPLAVYNYLVATYTGKFGFILYNAHVHVDVRSDSWYRENKQTDAN